MNSLLLRVSICSLLTIATVICVGCSDAVNDNSTNSNCNAPIDTDEASDKDALDVEFVDTQKAIDNMQRVVTAHQMIFVSPTKKKRLFKLRDKEIYGSAFFHELVNAKVMDKDVLDHIHIAKSPPKNDGTDSVSESTFATLTPALIPRCFSYKGSKRTIIMCLSSKYWNAYPSDGVLLMFSDGQHPEFMTLADAKSDWDITEEMWKNPKELLFGKKAPFLHVND